VDRPPEEVWRALGEHLSRPVKTKKLRTGVLGVEPRRQVGNPLITGSSVTGFAVTRAIHGRMLEMRGRHHFSEYALTFVLEPHDEGGTNLRAMTNARFPGPHGQIYRGLILGSRLHARVLRRVLRSIKRRAEH
jgi:hypothetical protein